MTSYLYYSEYRSRVSWVYQSNDVSVTSHWPRIRILTHRQRLPPDGVRVGLEKENILAREMSSVTMTLECTRIPNRVFTIMLILDSLQMRRCVLAMGKQYWISTNTGLYLVLLSLVRYRFDIGAESYISDKTSWQITIELYHCRQWYGLLPSER